MDNRYRKQVKNTPITSTYHFLSDTTVKAKLKKPATLSKSLSEMTNQVPMLQRHLSKAVLSTLLQYKAYISMSYKS